MEKRMLKNLLRGAVGLGLTAVAALALLSGTASVPKARANQPCKQTIDQCTKRLAALQQAIAAAESEAAKAEQQALYDQMQTVCGDLISNNCN